eukprot:6202183-Pleurochrysis_carterae.AAC.2
MQVSTRSQCCNFLSAFSELLWEVRYIGGQSSHAYGSRKATCKYPVLRAAAAAKPRRLADAADSSWRPAATPFRSKQFRPDAPRLLG